MAVAPKPVIGVSNEDRDLYSDAWGVQAIVPADGRADADAPTVAPTPASADESALVDNPGVNDAPVATITGPATRFGTEFLVNTVTLNSQTEPTITALSSGGFVVSWSDQSGQGGDAGGFGVKAQLFDAAGVRVGAEFLVNTTAPGNQREPTVTGLSSGGFVVSWTDEVGGVSGVGIQAQLFDAAGVKVGGEFRVNTATENGQTQPTIAALPSGGFVVSWNDNSQRGADASGSGIKAQLFDAAGVRVGGEFLVNTTMLNSQLQPTVATLPSGGFVVSWTDQTGDTSGFGVKAQLFDAAGLRLGGEFLVNTAMLSTQQQPTVTGLSSGGFVVSWSDNSGQGGDANAFGIKAQLFDAAGAKVGVEFLVNTATLGGQMQPTVTGLPSGDFVVSWNDDSRQGGDASGTGIKAQRFGPSAFAATEQIALGLKGTMSVADIDGGTVIATLTVGTGILAVTAGTSGATVADSGTATVTLTGTVAQINALLGSDATSTVSFTADSDTPPATTTLTLAVDDGGNGGGAARTGGASQTITIRAVEDAFVAGDDRLAAVEDIAITFTAAQLTGNDGDPDTPVAFTITSVAPVSGGRAVLNGDGSVTFTPDADFNGSAAFDYTITDDRGRTDTGRADVAVASVNDAPVNGVPDAQAGTEDTALVFSAANGNAITVGDADGGSLTATLGVENGTLTLAGTAGLTVTGNGTGAVTIQGTAEAINAALNGLSYRGDVDFEGSDTLTLRTSDGVAVDVDTVAITLADDGRINGTVGDDQITGTPEGDVFILSDGGDDDVSGLSGDDGFYFGGAMTRADRVNGGDGDDQVGLQGDYEEIVLGAGSLDGIETLVLLPGSDTRFGGASEGPTGYALTTANGLLAPGALLIVNMNTLRPGENVTFDGRAETAGSFLFYGGQGEDALTGGQRSDGFFFGGDGRFGANDRVDGQAGEDDQLGLQGDYSGTRALTLGAGQIAGIETIVLLTAGDTRFGSGSATGFGYTLTAADGNIDAGTLTINANTLRAGEVLTFDGSAEDDSGYLIFAGAGDDRITGGARNDTIVGGQGDDRITGGLGADRLAGGAGNDLFVYTDVLQSTAAARDTIDGFASGDKIDLAAIDAIGGTTDDDAFTYIGDASFTAAGQLRLVQNDGSWFAEGDVDGDGVADIVIQINVEGDYIPGAGDFNF